MPATPEVALILEQVARSTSAPYRLLSPEQARAHYAKASLVLEASPQPVAQVSDIDITLSEPQRRLRARLYRPDPAASAALPVVLYFHGGGFTIGSIDTHDRVCRRLAAGSGTCVLSVDYRLAPEHPFPAAFDDAWGSVLWLRAYARTLGLDAGRMVVAGDSAGGTLAAACAIQARDSALPLAGQLLLYPGLSAHQVSGSHQRYAKGYLLDADTVQWFFSQVLRSPQDRADWRFAPLQAANLEGVTRAHIVLAELDPLLDDGLAYAQRLQQAAVEVHCQVVPGMLHAFLQHGGRVPQALETHRAIGERLRQWLA
jgi:acetyl esterase